MSRDGGMIGRYRTKKSLEALIRKIAQEFDGGGELNEAMVGSVYITPVSSPISSGILSIRSVLQHYIRPGAVSPIDGTTSTLSRFWWESSMTATNFGIRQIDDSIGIFGNPSLARGAPSGVRLNPLFPRAITVSWAGGEFVMRRETATFRSGDRPAITMNAISNQGDYRILSGDPPDGPYTGTWSGYHVW